MASVLAQAAKTLSNREKLLPRLRLHLLNEHRNPKRMSVVLDSLMTLDTFMERLEKYKELPVPGYFHPSGAGGCMREKWYKYWDAPCDTEPNGHDLFRSYMIMETGTYVHVMFQNLCQHAKVLKAREIHVLSHKRQIEGHADGIVTLEGKDYLLEIKTANSRSFAMVQKQNGPPYGYKLQMHYYMKELGLKSGILVYLDKDRHAAVEFEVPFDPVFYKNECRKRLSMFHEIPKEPIEAPAREGSVAHRPPCMFCQYKQLCYNDFSHASWMKNRKNVDEESLQKWLNTKGSMFGGAATKPRRKSKSVRKKANKGNKTKLHRPSKIS